MNTSTKIQHEKLTKNTDTARVIFSVIFYNFRYIFINRTNIPHQATYDKYAIFNMGMKYLRSLSYRLWHITIYYSLNMSSPSFDITLWTYLSCHVHYQSSICTYYSLYDMQYEYRKISWLTRINVLKIRFYQGAG